ncbi:MAG TPA: response regulator [Crinalium sp.]
MATSTPATISTVTGLTRQQQQQSMGQLSSQHQQQDFRQEGTSMVNGKTSPDHISITEFNASKQVQFFDGLRTIRFSGQLSLKSPLVSVWTFYFYLGRILYATGGTHPVRRWMRNLTAYCPQLDIAQFKSMSDLASPAVAAMKVCWEYQALCSWVDQQKITREQASKVVWSIVSEVLFDVTQANEIIYLVESSNSVFTPLILFDAERLIADVQQKWQLWQQAKVVDRSPNQAPIIQQPERLQQQISAASYQTLATLLNGKRTLRDLAIKRQRDVAEVTRSLLPYIQAGFVKLVDVPDFPVPFAGLPTAATPISTVGASATAVEGLLVACVDDSPAVCRVMETILTQSGYRFVGVQDSLRAIATLLTRKPDLIFLDLVMPDTNGYEICSQLRKVSAFRDTPIVILTGNDGIVDRVRAKMVGASDFLGKPVNAETVLAVAHKHLKHLQQNSSLIVG